MSNLKFSRTAAIAAAAALSWSFASAATQNMSVSALVVGACKLVSVPTLNFGLLDQVLAPAVGPIAVTVTYSCTKNAVVPTFTVGGAAAPTFNGILTNTVNTDTISYTIGWAAPTAAATGFGAAAQSVSLNGNMLGGANYQNVSAGSYIQSVPVTIIP